MPFETTTTWDAHDEAVDRARRAGSGRRASDRSSVLVTSDLHMRGPSYLPTWVEVPDSRTEEIRSGIEIIPVLAYFTLGAVCFLVLFMNIFFGEIRFGFFLAVVGLGFVMLGVGRFLELKRRGPMKWFMW